MFRKTLLAGGVFRCPSRFSCLLCDVITDSVISGAQAFRLNSVFIQYSCQTRPWYCNARFCCKHTLSRCNFVFLQSAMSMGPPASLVMTIPLPAPPAPARESTPQPTCIPDVVEMGSNLTVVRREPPWPVAAMVVLEPGAQSMTPIWVHVHLNDSNNRHKMA